MAKIKAKSQSEMLLVDRNIQLNPNLSFAAKMVDVLVINQDKCGSTVKEMAEYINESEEFIEKGLKELEDNGSIEIDK